MKPLVLSIIPLFLVLLFFVGILFKRNKITFQTFIIWCFVWVVMAFSFIFPESIDLMSNFFGMNNRMFFVFTIAIVILFIFVFLNFTQTKQNELTLIKLVQHISLIATSMEELKENLEKDENNNNNSSI